MATPAQMIQLAASKSTDFDRLFLKLMIAHHDGAITMVEDLREWPGSTYDPQLNEFASDVSNDQAVEIERMNGLLVGLSTDPRAGLAPGLYDAGEAIMNLQLLSSLRKPLGFYDPGNPIERGADKPDASEDEQTTPAEGSKDDKDKPQSMENAAQDRRYPMLSFANTDMAFSNDVLVTGSYHGFNMYRIDAEGIPVGLSSVVCPGGQGDVSIVGDLLIMSVEQTRGRLDCGLKGVVADASPERFRGLRIFDISDLTRPKQVGAVQTCRGSHTHSVVAGPTADGKIIVYNSGTSSVREEEELESCIDELPGDDRTALFRIDVIEIPITDPSKSRIVSSPAVFADPKTGALAGLWRGGDHGDDTQDTWRTDQCHDITVFPSANLAAGACSGNGILFDISDPLDPVRIDTVTDTGFAYWHSATFNNAGDKILFTDEWGGGSRARCRAWDPLDWGANAIYDIDNGKLEFQSHYKMPAPQLETENCVAHNGSIIPVPGRDIFVQAWYQGGLSVIDFTDSNKPFEIAYFDRGPVLEDELIVGGYWSAYYYQGRIYGTEITRGLDVLTLLPSEYLSANEIAAAALAYPSIGPRKTFNPQQQIPMSWPASPIVARVYIDQLFKDGAINAKTAKRVIDIVDVAERAMASGGDKNLSRRMMAMKILATGKNSNNTDRERLKALRSMIQGLAKELR
jgi:polyhydroxyalkanoate synthesis regulator phasin